MNLLNIFNKRKAKESKKISRYIYSITEMGAYDYIKSSRDYLDYIEEHLVNVARAFSELSDACDGKEHWVGDDCSWHELLHEIKHHDLSKLSKQEFVQYRDNFFPTNEKDKENSDFALAWENHKQENHHHHETASNYYDLVHMVVDWIAMSYKFKDDPYDFYLKTKPAMGSNITPDFHRFIDAQFKHLREYRAKRG